MQDDMLGHAIRVLDNVFNNIIRTLISTHSEKVTKLFSEALTDENR